MRRLRKRITLAVPICVLGLGAPTLGSAAETVAECGYIYDRMQENVGIGHCGEGCTQMPGSYVIEATPNQTDSHGS